MMGLGYPGGPNIAAYAEKGEAGRFVFPRPMVDRPGLDMSFSGLKTYCLNTVQACGGEQNMTEQDKADIAHAFQEAVAETLYIKCRRALKQTGHDTLVMAGGVSANLRLRERLAEGLAKQKAQVHYPRHSLCTDNGAMIAYAGCLRLMGGEQQDDLHVRVRARWPLFELEPLTV